MADVVRQDVVEVVFDVDDSPLHEILKELKQLKASIEAAFNSDAFDAMKENADEANESIKDIKETAKKAKSGLDDVNKTKFTKLKSGLQSIISKLGTIAKKAAAISFKALTVGITACAAAIGSLVAKSVSAYADFEQLKGGVETLFGAQGAKSVEDYAKLTGKTVDEVKGKYNKLLEAQDIVFKNANNAYKTSGLSANDYMTTVTGFSASLVSSLGGDTVKAANLADQALIDMADNANKMGTPMENIQNAYQAFAKQNYMLLDNLKLGYGGTKTEMERLVKDASKMKEGIAAGVKADDLSFGNIVKAIHAVQEHMGITGTTAKEASTTITGSLSSMRAAWGNLMPALIQGGDQFDQCLKNLIESIVGVEDETGKRVGGVINNLLPAIQKSLSGIGVLIEELAPIIEEQLPVLIDELLPPLIKAATSLFIGLVKALPNIISSIAKEIPNILKQLGEAIGEAFGGQFPIFKKFGDFLKNNAESIKKVIPAVLGLVGAFMAFAKVKKVTSFISELFGSKSGDIIGGGEKGKGITGIFSSLAKTNTKTVLKGMANLAIIIGGITLIAVAFMALSPYLAEMNDMKSLVEVLGVVTILGGVGTALAYFGGIVGKIPVATVAKGLANMAIMLGGMSALFLVIGALTFLDFDYLKMLKITGILGVLGAVGAALSVFAGIAGMIPIPTVLMGLANIALVLGGLSAIVVAFGALSKIEGFNEFLSKGGDTLAILFNALGKIVGSVIGGLGEGITNSLPKIGENLSMFAKSLQPMFEMFKSADMEGIGSFFKAIGAFMLQMAGEKVLSLFGGETSLADLGTQLNTFAEKSQGFFTKVAEFPENGFTNATKLFNCLAGMKSLPKEGGIVGWFTGAINYENLASGLGHLSSGKVTGFFKAIAGIEQAGFDNATKLFDCLAGMKSLPSEGGVKGWFTGDINYQNIASGLAALASEGCAKFFTMVGGLSAKTFDNMTLLFQSLAGMGELPDESSWWDKLTGNETSSLGDIATQLSDFATNSKTFFEQINTLNLDNLNGLWESLNKAETVTTNISTVVGNKINEIVEKVRTLPVKMGEALRSSGKALSDSLVSIWTAAVKASVAPVNKVLSAANWILKEFGSEKRVAAWTPYAKGTDGHKGGNALVNDGRGAELVQMPNGSTFIPQGRNVFIPNAPKGMKVLSAEQTARLFGRKTPTFHYENGTGNIDLWSYIDNAKGLVGKIAQGISYGGASGLSLSIGKGMVSTITGEMSTWVEKVFDELGALSIADYVASKGVSQWRTTVARALKMEGQYSAANLQRTLYQMQTESGGNPRAINLWDSNAKKGIPSKGLMQVIDPTFKAYARSGFNRNIYDPLSNILASVRYAVSRYGSLAKAYRGVGYENGGLVTKAGWIGEYNKPEMVIPLSKDKRDRGVSLWEKTGQMLGLASYSPEQDSHYYNTKSAEYNTYAPQFNLTISGTNDDRSTARKVKQWIDEALDDKFTTLAHKKRRVREV